MACSTVRRGAGCGTYGHGQLERAQLIRRGGCHLCQAVARRAGAVQDTGRAGAFLGEQVKAVVEQVHLQSGLVDRAGCHVNDMRRMTRRSSTGRGK